MTRLRWIVPLLAAGLLSGCTTPWSDSPSDAIAKVEKLGFTDVQVVTIDTIRSGQLKGCGRNDLIKYVLEAIDPMGHTRLLKVCGPAGGYKIEWFKGYK